jgi:hypothetical protein
MRSIIVPKLNPDLVRVMNFFSLDALDKGFHKPCGKIRIS